MKGKSKTCKTEPAQDIIIPHLPISNLQSEESELVGSQKLRNTLAFLKEVPLDRNADFLK